MSLTKEVLAVAKEEGLELAEETVEQLVKIVFRGAAKYVQATENKFDDMALAVFPAIEQIILKEVDKIHKEAE